MLSTTTTRVWTTTRPSCYAGIHNSRHFVAAFTRSLPRKRWATDTVLQRHMLERPVSIPVTNVRGNRTRTCHRDSCSCNHPCQYRDNALHTTSRSTACSLLFNKTASLSTLDKEFRPATISPQQYRFFSTSNNSDDDNEDDNSTKSTVSPQDLELAVNATTDEQPAPMPSDLPGTTAGGGRRLAIVFTCKVCETRSAKQFSEQAYNNGVVMVRCPGCSNLHLIADRLGFFTDQSELEQAGGWDIEKAMAKMGESVRAVNNDNVLELTLDDVLGDKLMDAVNKNKKATNEESAHETKPQ